MASIPFERTTLFRLAWAGVCLLVLPVSGFATPQPGLRVLIDAPPLTLNPRETLDATGQKLGSLLFRALIRLDAKLRPQPDLARSWAVSKDGREWTFDIVPSAVDHAGEPITAARLQQCLEDYRAGTPASAVRGAFPSWIATEVDPRQPGRLKLKLSEPDPYLLQNLALVRYFRVQGVSQACPGVATPAGSPLVGSGDYRFEPWEPSPQGTIDLRRVDPGRSELQPRLEVVFVRDDNTRALKLIRGDVDAIMNGLSLAKTRWVKEKHSDRFDVLESPGVSVSYLGFNHRNPILARVEIRRALAMAIEREAVVRHKMFGFGRVAGSFLAPQLEDAVEVPVPYDPAESERILDRVGLRRGAGGVRFVLTYGTTPVREGSETALLVREMLAKIGVVARVEVVEPAVFIPRVQQGRFDLFSSRWVGVSDASIFNRTLRTGQPRNRVGYSDAEMDALLDRLKVTRAPVARSDLLARIQARMVDRMAYFPLWFWNNALIVRKGAVVPEISMSGGLDPLARIRLVR